MIELKSKELQLTFEPERYTVPTDTRGYIYIVIDKDEPDFIKVGRTNNIVKRLSAYNGDRPSPKVSLLAISEMFNDVKEVEKKILNYLKKDKGTCIGKLEWFNKEVYDELLNLIDYFEQQEGFLHE